MLAIILAGGLGTRLRPYTVTIPKPLLPLGDIPILEVVVRQLVAAGFDRIVLTLGHMPHYFSALLDDGSRLGARLEYQIENSPRGTAGAISLVESLEDDFLVMNGDILTTLNYRELVQVHKQRAAAATIAVASREHRVDYGVIETTSDGLLMKYDEKPRLKYRVSMGINMLSRRCVDYVPATGKFDMPDLLTAMVADGHTVACHDSDCYWQDIGRFDDYERANADFVSNPTRFVPDYSATS